MGLSWRRSKLARRSKGGHRGRRRCCTRPSSALGRLPLVATCDVVVIPYAADQGGFDVAEESSPAGSAAQARALGPASRCGGDGDRSGGRSRSPGQDRDQAKAVVALASFSSPRKAKTVRMSEARDVVIIPYAADQGGFDVAEETSSAGSAGAARGLGSSSGVPSEGALQDTPDYIRRSAARHRVAPLELFSDSVSPPPPPAPAGLGAVAEGMDSIEKCHAAGGVSESEAVGGDPTDSERLQPEEIEEEKSNCYGLLKQQYGVLLREKEECRRLLEDLMRENVRSWYTACLSGPWRGAFPPCSALGATCGGPPVSASPPQTQMAGATSYRWST